MRRRAPRLPWRWMALRARAASPEKATSGQRETMASANYVTTQYVFEGVSPNTPKASFVRKTDLVLHYLAYSGSRLPQIKAVKMLSRTMKEMGVEEKRHGTKGFGYWLVSIVEEESDDDKCRV